MGALVKFFLLACLALAQGKPQQRDPPRLWEPHAQCADKPDHYLLPHEYLCTKFYYCEYGMKYIEPTDCAPGTEFSYELQVCIWPYLANCNLPGHPTTPGPEDDKTEEPCTEDDVVLSTEAPRPQPPASTPAPEPQPPVSTPAPEPQPPVSTPAPEPEPPVSTPAPEPEPPVSTPAPEPQPPASTPAPEPEPPVSTPAPEPQPPASTPAPEPQPPASTPAPTQAPTQAPTSAPGTSDPCDDEFLPNGCPADFEIHLLLPHEQCNKFYQCNFGEKVEKQCASGTYFNPTLQVCDWPWNVDCAPDNGGDDNGGGDNGGDDNGGDCGGSCGTDTEFETLPNGCPADWSIHQLLPHETDCGKFYYCVHGQLVERDCAPGTHFNPILQVCDWPHSAGCVNGGGDNEDDDNGNNCNGGNNCGGENGGDDNGGDDNGGDDNGGDDNGGDDNGGDCGGTCGTEIETLPNGCPADFSIHQLLPHESDCGKFYYCVHGQLVERDCAPGTHFNPVLQVCDWPEAAGCEQQENCGGTCGGDNGGDDNGGNDNGGDDNGGDDNGGDDNGGDDNGGDDNGGEDNGGDDNGGDDNGGDDNGGDDNGGDDNGGDDNGGDDNGGDDNGGDDNGGDDNGGDDNGGDDNGGDDNGGDDNGGDDNGGDDNGGDDNGGDDNGGDDNGGDDNGGDVPICPICPGGGETPEERCKNNCNVLPWAHDDCDKFYQCDGETPIITICSEGLHFNPNTHTCDFICNAGCVRTEIQTTSGPDGIRLFLPWDRINKSAQELIDLAMQPEQEL